MDDGIVIESGTHDDLLQANGAYARLVQTQRLREGRERSGKDSDNDSEDSGPDTEEDAAEEILLVRKNTGRSLASEILEQRRQATEDQSKRGDYGLFYLAKRMSVFFRDQWRNYFFGAVFACRKYMIFHHGVSSFLIQCF